MSASLPQNASIAYQSDLFTIYRWPQQLYDGSTKTFECCVRPNGVVVMGFLDPETIILTKQEQPHRVEPFFDLPGGRVEADEEPEAAARREFLEETGYEIGRLIPWHAHTQGGTIQFTQHFFFARDLHARSDVQNPDAGERIRILPIHRQEFTEHCLKDRLRNRLTALLWLQLNADPERQRILNDFLR